MECAFTVGVAVSIAVVVVVGGGVGVVAPFFKRMDFVADAVVILMLFLTLLCEYVIVISCFSLLSLSKASANTAAVITLI